MFHTFTPPRFYGRCYKFHTASLQCKCSICLISLKHRCAPLLHQWVGSLHAQNLSSTNHLCTVRQASECFTTLPLNVFTQIKLVADFLDRNAVLLKSHFAFFSALWGFRGNYTVHLSLTRKPVVDFLLVITELLSQSVTAEVIQANIKWKSAFLKGVGHFDIKFHE